MSVDACSAVPEWDSSRLEGMNRQSKKIVPPMPPREHVVITGTGRSGTTFLVELLTHLGLETGFTADDIATRKFKEARAGLEFDIRKQGCPFIVKSPFFCDYAKEVIRSDDIVIEHIFVPIRDLNAAAESRRFVAKTKIPHLPILRRLKYLLRPWKLPGGLAYTRSIKPGQQEEALLKQIYKLMLAISGTTLPVTFMRYPRIVKDCPYLFKKLNPILRDITYESFHAAFNKAVRPELVHSFNQDDC